MKGTTDEVVLEKNCGHMGVLPGEKVQMVRKVVGCGCVYARGCRGLHLSGWWGRTLLITFHFP